MSYSVLPPEEPRGPMRRALGFVLALAAIAIHRFMNRSRPHG
jgi:hypothetical protein